MILCVENWKTPESIKSIRINKLKSAKLQDTKSTHKNYSYSCTINNGQPKNETKKMIPFILVWKRILGNKLNQGNKNCTMKTAKCWWKKLKKTQINERHSMLMDWKTILLSTLLKVIYRFNTICIKIPMIFFCRNRKKSILKLMECQRSPNSQNNLEKEEQSWGSHILWFQNLL